MGANHTSGTGPNYTRLATIGLEFASPIIGGLIAGYYLGEYFHRFWIGPLALFGGVFLGFYRLIVELRHLTKDAQ